MRPFVFKESVTYTASGRNIFVNGPSLPSAVVSCFTGSIVGVDYDGTPNGNKLALGFIQARDNRVITDDWANYATGTNHFKGLIDDLRIFSEPLTATEVQLMYNSEK